MVQVSCSTTVALYSFSVSNSDSHRTWYKRVFADGPPAGSITGVPHVGACDIALTGGIGLYSSGTSLIVSRIWQRMNSPNA